MPDIAKTILILAGLILLYLLRDVLMVLFFAITIASAVGPFADWLESKRVPRLLGVLVLYFVVVILGSLLLAILVPVATYELRQLTLVLPKFFSDASIAFENIPSIQGLLDSLGQFLQFSSGSVVAIIVGIFGNAVSFIAIVVISFYLSVAKNGIRSFLESVLPEKYEGYVIGLWKRAEIKVGRWFQGQLLLALSVGLIVFVGLSILNIKYALLLGITAMVFELVPIVGPVLFAIPAILLAFAQSDGVALGLGVALFYLIVQQLENHVFTPLILGKSTGLNPVTVIIALLIGAKLAGILGILLAVPVAVVIVEILDDMAEQRKATR